MTTFLPRSAWTDTAPGGSVLTGTKLQGVACHYPASGDIVMANLTQEQVASRLRGWRNYHVNTKGWSDIGYQMAVDGQGRIWDLRGITRVPAAHASGSNPDANEEFGAMLWVLGNNETPTQEAIQAFRDWRHGRWLVKWPGRTNVRGHRQVPGAQTDCPGDKLIALIGTGSLSLSGGTVVDVTIAAQAVRWAVNGTRPDLSPGEPLLTDSYAHDAHQFMAFASPAGIGAIPWTTFNAWLAYRDEPSSPFGPFGQALALYAVKCVQAKAGIEQTGYLGAETAAYIEQFGYNVTGV